MSEIIKPESSKIVLGHPLSASLYAYFDKELNSGRNTTSITYHPYYKTLYGKHYEKQIDLSLALSLIYENIFLVPADNAFPDLQKYHVDGVYYNPDFGLYFDQNEDWNSRNSSKENIQLVLEDPHINILLSGIPKRAHDQIIQQVIAELSLAAKFNAPLFTLGKRQMLAKRMAQINAHSISFADSSQVKLVSSYIEITGLLFQPMNIDSFYYLKSEKDLRAYANSFIEVIENVNLDNPSDIKKELLLLIKEAMNKDKISNRIFGIFKTGSDVTNYVGLIPLVGTIAGLTGIGADWTAKGIDKWNEKNIWYELAAQVEKTKSQSRINAALKDIK